MWGFLGSIIPSAVSAVSNWFSSSKEVEAQKQINEQNIALARESRDWSERMSNTAHQREVADLRGAGLNPILSARYGGAVTPAPVVPKLDSPYSGYTANMVTSARDTVNALTLLPDVLLKSAQAKFSLSSSAKQEVTTRPMSSINRGLDALDRLIGDAASALGKWSARVRPVEYGNKMYNSKGELRTYSIGK